MSPQLQTPGLLFPKPRSFQSKKSQFPQHEIHPGESQISSVNLFASSQSNGANPLFEMSYLHNNSENPFIQESGFDIVSLLPEQSNSNLDGLKLNLDWELMIQWEFDDVETLFWFVAAENTDGLQIGPIRSSIGTSFNKAVENDVEIVNLTTVYHGQNLDDRFSQYCRCRFLQIQI